MGFFDNAKDAVNRGTAAAGREAEKLKIKSRMNELQKQRQNLAAQLGASLYELTKNEPAVREGREALYDGIEKIDTERADCQRQLAALEEQAAQAAQAAETFNCAVCGARMSGGDLYCAGCGSPVEQARPASMAPAATGPKCANCGAPMNADDKFCMSCGTPVAEATPDVAAAATAVVPVSEPLQSAAIPVGYTGQTSSATNSADAAAPNSVDSVDTLVQGVSE